MRGKQVFPCLGTEDIPKLGFCLLTVAKWEARVRVIFRWGSSFWLSRNVHILKFFFLTEKKIHAILTHQNKMCVLKVKDFPQILPYNELLLTTWFYSLDLDGSSNFWVQRFSLGRWKVFWDEGWYSYTKKWINLIIPNCLSKIILSICPWEGLLS